MILFSADRGWSGDSWDYSNWRDSGDWSNTGEWRNTRNWRDPSDWRHNRRIHRLVQLHYQQLLSDKRNRRAYSFLLEVLVVVYALLPQL